MHNHAERGTPRSEWRARVARVGACLAFVLWPLVTTAVVAAEAPATPPRFLTGQNAPPARWPGIRRPPAGAPNVLLVLTDDVAFGATSPFGGPIATPTVDRLAASGLRYTRFHTTALCSPTRSALLTGRQPNTINVGNVTNLATGFDGFDSVIPKSAATVAQLLADAGYATAMFGKSHVTPEWEQSSNGPHDRWPTGLGFQYFYGFLNADTSMYAPSLVENTRFVEPPYDDPDYFFERDMADRTIQWLRQQRAQDPTQPFFVYYAPGTAHAPHHAPPEWLARVRGKFDHGWDEQRERTFREQKRRGVIPANARLTPRPDALPAWSSLTPDEKRIAARYMEAYAAALSYMDAQVGRIIDEIAARGELDNTLVVFIQGDNGGSAEGGLEGTLFEQSMINMVREDEAEMLRQLDAMGAPAMYNNYPVGWAWAMSTPFQWYKQVASHFGGMRNGMVMSWPARIADAGGVREQFHFVADVAPTILAAAGVTPPASFAGVPQQPIDGVDMSYTFADAAAPGARASQAFSMMQHLGYYADGWFLSTTPLSMPWQNSQRTGASDGDARNWELYDLRNDYSQAVDLARREPAKLAAMQSAFWAEAERLHMLPVHSVYGPASSGRPSLGAGRTSFDYLPGVTRVAQDAAPPTVGRSYTITADIEVPAGANGVVLAQGGRFSGFSLFLKDGRPTFHYNAVPPRHATIAAETALAAGRHRLAFSFVADAKVPGTGGRGVLKVDDIVVAEGRIAHTLGRWISHTEGLDVGADTITAVSDAYAPPARFPGSIGKVNVTIDP